MLEKTELQGIQVQKFGEQEAIIRLQHQNLEQKKILDIIKTKLNDYPEKVIFQRVDFVSPKVSGELIQTGGYAITLATLAMLIYIWFRFEIQFGIGAVVAMLHDVLITLGIFSLFQLEFDIATIAALLTIVGYSMNDTVVIYDRIRENLKKYRKISLPTIIDASLNETMIRTLVTSGTSVLSLIALLIFGGEVIYNFVIAMTLGVVIGSYSSIFVASPILIWLGVGREKTKENNNNIGKKIEA
jgi:preprotein translocase SecF subunit